MMNPKGRNPRSETILRNPNVMPYGRQAARIPLQLHLAPILTVPDRKRGEAELRNRLLSGIHRLAKPKRLGGLARRLIAGLLIWCQA
ncbi:hypothetical protein GCM10010917_26080 [Paenibacillus physcomitrellae]|uniref:Uncharacterized protein n=1 Tax=Paenibacillus physcomitrellae TaxID=1619311 RepID=A0ABQ1G9X2_9BACL|nr:hypothetical protein GCM10010917_26080 [Paenibacillus physcomitrellae]